MWIVNVAMPLCSLFFFFFFYSQEVRIECLPCAGITAGGIWDIDFSSVKPAGTGGIKHTWPGCREAVPCCGALFVGMC